MNELIWIMCSLIFSLVLLDVECTGIGSTRMPLDWTKLIGVCQ